MANDNLPEPRQYPGVMVSSTFDDLKEHRAALIKAIKGRGLTEVAMENDSAKPDLDVIESSLQMVRDASAYIGVIGHKYGRTPECPRQNPGNLSLTELEFNEAQRLKRPILLFIMGPSHPVPMADVETDAGRIKLEAFRERAKKMRADSSVHRVYATFDSLGEFERKAIHAVANLRTHLEKQAPRPAPPPAEPDKPGPDSVPAPPAFYAEPPYIGSHEFVGRERELITLDDWASAADPYSILLFEAIGGAGKSMITWEWVNKWATTVREDWAGRFWYSFYERGADMSDFCRRAMAYVTRRPLSDFRGQKTTRLAKLLITKLRARPWLLVLDGLERVLVAYHRFDAAQVADEEAGATDQIAHRDPCSAIRPEDDDLLRALAAAAPSKLLVTSRLIPRVLLDASRQPIPGVLHERLPGLRPADAEALLRSCGVTGGSREMQDYLKRHCDCHPLVTGVLAGLINEYLPDRGNFDAWEADPDHGGRLNLADLDLVQKRNHILRAALDALPQKSRQLLSTLALLSEAVDDPTLSALSPHLPPAPAEVAEPQKLAETVRDLERRGLLQYDARAKRYDLHPVVRGIAAGGLRPEEKERYGQRVVDHFSRQPHSPYGEAETLEDVRHALNVVRTLLQMGHYQQAANAYRHGLAIALTYNLEAHAEIFSLLRPFFTKGWAVLPDRVSEEDGSYLASAVAASLYAIGDLKEALTIFDALLLADLRRAMWVDVLTSLAWVSTILSAQNRSAKEERCLILALSLAALVPNREYLFQARLFRFEQLAEAGRWADAEAMWRLLDPMGRSWPRYSYHPGAAECSYARFLFWRGDLREEHLAQAEQLARSGRNRLTIRSLHRLRGEWLEEQGRWAPAADSLREAVRMAREVGMSDEIAETRLALAQLHLGQLPDARHEAEQLARGKRPAHRALAELWLAIGDPVQAKKHALAAYRGAWGDGEPYVYRYDLNKARALLERLGAEAPELPPYDPATDEKFPWEDELAADIEKLRAEKEAEKAAQTSEGEE